MESKQSDNERLAPAGGYARPSPRFPGEGPKSKNWRQRLARAMKHGTGMTLSPGEVPYVFELLESVKETNNSFMHTSMQVLRRSTRA